MRKIFAVLTVFASVMLSVPSAYTCNSRQLAGFGPGTYYEYIGNSLDTSDSTCWTLGASNPFWNSSVSEWEHDTWYDQVTYQTVTATGTSTSFTAQFERRLQRHERLLLERLDRGGEGDPRRRKHLLHHLLDHRKRRVTSASGPKYVKLYRPDGRLHHHLDHGTQHLLRQWHGRSLLQRASLAKRRVRENEFEGIVARQADAGDDRARGCAPGSPTDP